MKQTLLKVLFILSMCSAMGQITNVAEKFALPITLSESSGVIYFNNKLLTHNDSGNSNALYEVDLTTGLITRTITISNAINIDWEDMTQDDTSIYIGDIGNNINGNRTDLKIYKISKTDYLSMETVTAETISFSYSDQTDFTPVSNNNTEWDAEALVSFDTSNLIVFTKNWVNGITKGYLVPKTPGTYSLTPLATTFNSGGLISGGTYNPLTGKLYLLGYTAPVLPLPLQPFVWKIEDFTGSDVFSGTNTLTSLSSTFSFEQTEAITYINENSYLITSEAFSVSILSDYAKVIEFSTNDVVLSLEKDYLNNAITLYPNPVKDFLIIDSKDAVLVEIYDTKLSKLFQGHMTKINMARFAAGMYLVKINFENEFSITKKVIKN